MHKNIKVSVIIPVFNAERFLRECLDSVLEQTLIDIEIICIDDASCDGSLEILKEYSAKDKRFKLFMQSKNQFTGVARNRGMDEASGKYLAFWDADDFFEPDALERLYNQCEQDESDVCVSRYRIFDMKSQRVAQATHSIVLAYLPEEIPFSPEENPDYLFHFCTPSPWSKLFRREFIQQNNLRFQDLKRSNDMYFVFMAIALARRITIVDDVLVNYRQFTSTSLQETYEQSPFDFLYAFNALRLELTKRDLFALFEKSFIIRFFLICDYHLSMAKTKEAWLKLALRIKDEVINGFGFPQLSKDYFIVDAHYELLDFIINHTPDELLSYEPVLRHDETSNELFKDRLSDESLNDCDLKFSVIIPVYNAEEHIKESLHSVMRQTLKNIEIICVDDGSTDNSVSIMENLQNKDKRIRIISQKNSGPSAARNTGLKKAGGEYISFLDSDDLLAWCALEHLYLYAKDNQLDELFFSAESFYDSVSLYKKHHFYRSGYQYHGNYESISDGAELFLKLNSNHDFISPVVLQVFRRSFLEENNINFYPGIINEYYLFTLQCILRAERVAVLNEPLYQFRIRSGSYTTSGNTWEHIYGYFVCMYEIGNDLKNLKKDNTQLKKAISEYLMSYCLRSLAMKLNNSSKEKANEELDLLYTEEAAGSALLPELIKQCACLEKQNEENIKILTAEREKNEESKKQLEDEKEKIIILRKKLKQHKNSYSYRMGKALTAPVRFIRKNIAAVRMKK